MKFEGKEIMKSELWEMNRKKIAIGICSIENFNFLTFQVNAAI